VDTKSLSLLWNRPIEIRFAGRAKVRSSRCRKPIEHRNWPDYSGIEASRRCRSAIGAAMSAAPCKPKNGEIRRD
jgi:hypothetical protein